MVIKPNSWWEVKLWWHGPRGNTYESGGHFSADEGDTPLKVLQQVADCRGVKLDDCFEVFAKLHERDS